MTATGDGTLSYQWQKDSVNITGATAATLQITQRAAAANVGQLPLRGDRRLRHCDLQQRRPDPQCGDGDHRPAATAVGCGFGTANFSVTATGARLTYQWQKNSVNLSNGGNISGATTATLDDLIGDCGRRGQLPLRGDRRHAGPSPRTRRH